MEKITKHKMDQEDRNPSQTRPINLQQVADMCLLLVGSGIIGGIILSMEILMKRFQK